MESVSSGSRLRKARSLLRSAYRRVAESIFRTMVQVQRDKSNRQFQHHTAGEALFRRQQASQALHERGMLRPGSRGLGFGVGREPLLALFASLGCEIVATDLPTEEAHKGCWVDGVQHAGSLEGLNGRGICSPEEFREKVSFRFVDMRKLLDDLRDVRFCLVMLFPRTSGYHGSGRRIHLPVVEIPQTGWCECPYNRIQRAVEHLYPHQGPGRGFSGGETYRESQTLCVDAATSLTWISRMGTCHMTTI